MSTSIKREDIQPGDTIKVTIVEHGVLSQRMGKVQVTNKYGLLTLEGGTLHDNNWAGNYTFDLIDRPKPQLPTEPGSVIIATEIRGVRGRWHLLLDGDKDWCGPAIEDVVIHHRDDITEWTPAKIVAAE